MSDLHLPPVNTWTGLNAEGYLYLVDPIDGAFDPNSPPSYIQNDPQISEGLNYLSDNGRFFGVNLSLGPTEDEYSLGVPGWVEEQIAGVDAFGHNVDPALTPPNGHYERVMNLLDGLEDGKAFCYVPGFETVRNPADMALDGMRQYVEGAFAKIDDAHEMGGMASELAGELEGFAMAASVVVMNGLNWYSAGKIGLAAKRHYDGQPPISHHWDAFVPVDPLSADLGRKLSTLGVHVSEEPFRRYPEYWQEDDQALLIPRIMSTGLIA